MVHPAMVDVRYFILYHTHYRVELDLEQLVLKGQTDLFLNKEKGTEIPTDLMHLLRFCPPNMQYPVLGNNTSETDLVKATFALDRDTTTVMDIECLRVCESTEDYEDGPWSERGNQDDLHAKENRSKASQSLQH